MKRLILMVLLSRTALLAQTNRAERVQLKQTLQQAEEAYRSEESADLTKAADGFARVRESGREEELNHDALRLAEGMARLQANDPEGALKALEEVKGFESPAERSRHRRLTGVARMQQAEAQAAQEEWDPALESMRGAIDAFTQSLKEVPDSEASRHNLELAQRRLLEIQQRKPPPPTPTPTPTPSPNPTPTPTPTPEPEDQQQEPTPEPEGTPTPEPEDSEDASDNGDDQSDEEKDNQEGDSSQQSGESSEESNETTSPQEMTEEEMDAQEAARILEAYLEQEKSQRRQLLEERRFRTIPVEKDW